MSDYQFKSIDSGTTFGDFDSNHEYSLELHEYSDATDPYGIINTHPPIESTYLINDFREGTHFRTEAESGTNYLTITSEDRLLTIIIDESGSLTWNDSGRDRYSYLKLLLNILNKTYPGNIKTNLIGFGGTQTKSTSFISASDSDILSDSSLSYDEYLKASFQDSVFDFAGVRVIRRTDRFPTHPADGVVVADGIIESIKDEDLVEGHTYYYGIWTYNKNLHYSLGRYISAAPNDRILPSGVNYYSSYIRILPGVIRDQYTSVIYNFMEGSGYVILDSSGMGNHGYVGTEVVEHNFWSGDASSSTFVDDFIRKPVGVRFDGEFDIVEVPVDYNDVSPDANHGLTVNFWVYRYNNTKEEWVIGTSTATESNEIGWAIGITKDGMVGVQLNDISLGIIDTGSLLPIEIWTMITVIVYPAAPGIYTIELYVNGLLQPWSTILSGTFSSNIDTLYIGAKPTSSGILWAGNDYYGSINSISVHITKRNTLYIQDLYETELKIFDQIMGDSDESPLDNKQREVILNWEIRNDFDFEGGDVKIIRKYNALPDNISDGDLVATISASVGDFIYVDSQDFIHGGNYYYRIFTMNTLDNVCDLSESRVLSVHIPESINDPPDIPLSPVTDATITAGSKKLFLEWTDPTDDTYEGTKVFFNDEHYPNVSVDKNGKIQTDGIELLDTMVGYYTHRILGTQNGVDISLSNGHSYYYTIVTYDKFGRLSKSVVLHGVPSSILETVFGSDDVKMLHSFVINPTTLSIQWKNPTLRTEQLNLYFGDVAMCFVNIKDIYGGDLNNVDNIKFEVCASYVPLSILAQSTSLKKGPDDSKPDIENPSGGLRLPGSGISFPASRCFSPPEAEDETILKYAILENGLIRGMITHTGNRDILSKRKSYTMTARAKYLVIDENTGNTVFQYNTKPLSVKFTHPIKMAIVNKLNKTCSVTPGQNGVLRGSPVCECSSDKKSTQQQPEVYTGGYIGATRPYVARVEIQWKGEALPDGTSIDVALYEHKSSTDPDFLSIKSTRTIIREGSYSTSSVLVEELDKNGNFTGEFISKSVVDIEVPHPIEPDWIDLYIKVIYSGFFLEGVHDIRFIGTLFISANIQKPVEDGIEVAEQVAHVWTLDPDFPEDLDKVIPVPDGTVVKWELTKEQYGRDRPFYSTEQLPYPISGVYSTTISSVARSVFFGPVGNIEQHNVVKGCGTTTLKCCIGEEYSIKASVILGEQSAFDGEIFNYSCNIDVYSNKKFFITSHKDNTGENPHWVTWADGEHLLRFQIISDIAEALSDTSLDILDLEKFHNCIEATNSITFSFPIGHIIQVSSPGEILWDVEFETDPYTGIITPVRYSSVAPSIQGPIGLRSVANIPVRGLITDFYVRYDAFVGNSNPKPKRCDSGDSGPMEGQPLPECLYKNICDENDIRQKWDFVDVLIGQTTVLIDNKEVTMFAGGDYETGILPIKVGFKEPLYIQIIEARYGDEHGDLMTELVLNTPIVLVIEVTYANNPVPDGTPVDITLGGVDGARIVLTNPSNGTAYTRQVNDFRINPEGDKRSLCFVTIEGINDV